MNVGEMLLSAVIDRNDVGALRRFNIKESDFMTDTEKAAYQFIMQYAEMNRGQAPDYRTLLAHVPDFNYQPYVNDSFDYLAWQVKENRAKFEMMQLLESKETAKLFKEMPGTKFADWLSEAARIIKEKYDFREKVGVNILKEPDRYLRELRARKEGKSFKIWKSKFPTINREIGGYLSGNMYTWYGRSGRGKSIFVLEEAIEAAMQGARVLIWALEMSEFEVTTRAYTSISARVGRHWVKIDGVDYRAGFPARELLTGKLGDWEEDFNLFLMDLPEIVPGEIIVRAVDHEDFYHRGVAQLEADILKTKADVVIVDPIYYMDLEKNTSNTTGGDVANTSKKIRHIAGYTRAVIHVITQAEEVRDERDENGNRELRPPERAEIKKTKAVLEDATNIFGIDTCDGRGIIRLGKGRNGGEDVKVEVQFMPNYGIVREVEPGEMEEMFYDF